MTETIVIQFLPGHQKVTAVICYLLWGVFLEARDVVITDK